MHINEPECNVLLALENGKLAPSRYENYVNIIDNIKETNYWERK
jgi:putative ribosome biogenesis GTPase RsgA